METRKNRPKSGSVEMMAKLKLKDGDKVRRSFLSFNALGQMFEETGIVDERRDGEWVVHITDSVSKLTGVVCLLGSEWYLDDKG